jgi:glycosyltransferase involved in cell wall biosynthesis
MRIALAHSAFYEAGGAERVCFLQGIGLRALGHRVDFFAAFFDYGRCLRKFGVDSLELRAYIINKAVRGMEYTSSLGLAFLLAGPASRKLREYDVVICHHPPAPYIAFRAFRRWGIPYICFVHHPPRFIWPRGADRKLGLAHNKDRRVIQFLERATGMVRRTDLLAISHASAVLANSKRTAREVEAIYGVPATVCYPPISPALLQRMPDESVLTKLGVTKPYLLSVARHTPHKQLDWAIEVHRRLLSHLPNLWLVLVGSEHETYTKRLRELGAVAGRVVFISDLSDEELPALYAGAEAYLSTAPDEDFGLTVVEAMAMGTPVVAWADGSGVSETVQEDVTGFLCKPYDLDDYTRMCSKVINEGYVRDRARNAAEMIRRRFSLSGHIIS